MTLTPRFDGTALITGGSRNIGLACGEALVELARDIERIEATISSIKQHLQATGEREVKSRYVGERVMEALRSLDGVAYVRFASVYRSFQDISEFRQALDTLEQDPE